MAKRGSHVTDQWLVFGEIAEQYDEARPSYPGELFDAVMAFGDLSAGDAALEIGAGTGKATTPFVERGLRVHALEPSAPMAAVLRTKGIAAEEVTFEDWRVRPGHFRLLYAAQAWHWVKGDDRYEKAAAALAPYGTVAFFWNKARDWEGSLRLENEAMYERYAPEMTSSVGSWNLDWVAEQLERSGAFQPAVTHSFTWRRTYTSEQWVRLLGTHSDHRVLPEAQRTQLHAAVGNVIDAHGGAVDVIYDALLYLSRRA
jgi:SAM-dependent methyltransferase